MSKKAHTIALLGIDGSGKSTISMELKNFLESKGLAVQIIPFHKWVFAHYLKRSTSRVIEPSRPSLSKPYEPKPGSVASVVKPIVAFIDNIMFNWLNRPSAIGVDVVIFDRFICATQIKLQALNYKTEWMRSLWMGIRPDAAYILDINEEMSIKRQNDRGDRYQYTKEQLTRERTLYNYYAKEHDFPIIDNKDLDTTLKIIYKDISRRGIA